MAPYCLQESPAAPVPEMAYSVLNDEDQQSQGSSNNENQIEEELAGVYPPPPNALPESLQLENSLPQLLMSQCGVSEEYELTNKTHIRLRIISKDMSLQRLSVYMPSLVELDLSGSWLLSLRDLGCGLRIKILKVARCNLDCLDGLFGLSFLQELHASSNSIADIGSCAVLTHLQLLDLSRNRVNNLGEISFLGICSELTDLDLSENPVSEYMEYRDVVTQLLPGLIRLNGEPLAVHDKNDGNSAHEDNEDVDEESNDVSNDKTNIEENDKQVKELQEEKPQSVSLLSFAIDTGKENNSEKKIHRIRPSTSTGIRQSKSCIDQRPQTAGLSRKQKNLFNKETIPFVDIVNVNEENAASRLTSGGVVCGNLTAALRSRARQNKIDEKLSWCNQPFTVQQHKSSPPHVDLTTTTHCISTNNLNDVDDDDNNNNNEKDKSLNNDIPFSDDIKVQIEAEEKRIKEVNALLEASRKWREAFAKYRDTNREKCGEECKE